MQYKISTPIYVRYFAVNRNPGLTDLYIIPTNPNGVDQTSVLMTHLENGLYTATFTPNATGWWQVRVHSALSALEVYSARYYVGTTDDPNPVQDDTFTGRIGEVQTTPTTNTVLGRLKDLWDKLNDLFTNGTAKVKIWDGTNTANIDSANALYVSGKSAAGIAPSSNPLYVAGIDGGGLKRGILTDTTGRVKTAEIQDVRISTSNNSTTNIDTSTPFTGTGESTLEVAGIQINFIASQPCTIQVQQSIDNVTGHWDIIDSYVTAAGVGDSRTFQATASYVRVIVTNTGTATTTYFRLQTVLCPIVETVPRALTQEGRLKVDVGATSSARIPTQLKWEGTNAPPASNVWVLVASYTIPVGYNWTPYQTQYSAANSSSLIRVAEELSLGSLNTTTNIFTDGNSYSAPRFASYIELRMTQDCNTNMTITITYTNQDGTTGRTTTVALSGSGPSKAVIGNIYLLTLQGTDTGVRDITNISTSATGNGNCTVYGLVDITRDSADASNVVYTDTLEIGAYVVQTGKIVSLSVSSASTSSVARYVAVLGLLGLV
jgi:hypothetical protein